MLAADAAAAAGLLRRAPGPRSRWRPTVGFEALVAVAWVVALWWSIDGVGSAPSGIGASTATGSMPGMRSMPGMGSMPGMRTAAPTSAAHAAVAGLPMWIVMSVAMMLPAALPALGHVSTHSFRWRRGRAMTLFAVAYLGVWVVFGAGALLAGGLIHARVAVELGLVLVVAGAWQLTVYKRHALRDCHRSVPLPPRGWPAAAGAVRFGLVNGSACVRSCWPAMLAMAFVPGSQMWIWMPVLTGLMSAEKLARRPRRATRLVAGALALAAVGAAGLA
jgi:predicted metal-binding membrane protein